MGARVIYRKTEQGTEAIARRNADLAPRQRTLLILVDGRRSMEELATLAGGFGDVPELVKGLLIQGFIEAVEQREREVKPARAEPAVPLAQMQRHAVRRLNELLGPTATDLCLRLEECRTAQDFRAAVQRIQGVLREVVGPQKATRFVEEIESLRG